MNKRFYFSKFGQSSYALNKNLLDKKLSDANPDTVLLFETKEGWNQTADATAVHLNHNTGANFLFVSGKINFIKAENIPTLRWKP